MSGLSDLQEALPTWVRLERHQGQPAVTVREVNPIVTVLEVNDYPEAPPNAVRADVHFLEVAPTEGFPETDVLVKTVQAAFGQGEFMAMGAEHLRGGPSYITLGSWLGNQDLGLMLIGAVELAGLAKAITPKTLGVTDEAIAEQMAGGGLVMLGPWQGWGES